LTEAIVHFSRLLLVAAAPAYRDAKHECEAGLWSSNRNTIY